MIVDYVEDWVFLERYKKVLKELEDSKIDLSKAPKEVQESWLALHQAAQLKYWEIKKERER